MDYFGKGKSVVVAQQNTFQCDSAKNDFCRGKVLGDRNVSHQSGPEVDLSLPGTASVGLKEDFLQTAAALMLVLMPVSCLYHTSAYLLELNVVENSQSEWNVDRGEAVTPLHGRSSVCSGGGLASLYRRGGELGFVSGFRLSFAKTSGVLYISRHVWLLERCFSFGEALNKRQLGKQALN